MTAAATITTDPGGSATITLTGYQPGTVMVITRHQAQTPDVYFGAQEPPTWTDYAIPLGAQVTYTLDVTNDLGQPQTVQITATHDLETTAILQSMIAPSESVAVDIIPPPESVWEGRTSAHPVLADAEPMVTVVPSKYRAGRYELYAGFDTIPPLLSLMRTGHPLRLRNPCPTIYPTVTFIAEQWELTRWDPEDSTGARILGIDYAAIADTTPVFPTPWVYSELAALGHTYAQLRDIGLVYRELRDHTPPDPLAPGVVSATAMAPPGSVGLIS